MTKNAQRETSNPDFIQRGLNNFASRFSFYENLIEKPDFGKFFDEKSPAQMAAPDSIWLFYLGKEICCLFDDLDTAVFDLDLGFVV